jgi:hypothetical protein
MVHKKMNFLICFLVCVFLLLSFSHVSATVVWEDDFNDGDLKEWDLTSYYTPDFANVPVVKGTALIQNVNNRLLIPHFWNGTHAAFNVAERNSTQVYGHWGFDIDTTAGSNCGFAFIFRDVTPESDLADEGWYLQKPNGFEGYYLGISTVEVNHQLLLARMNANFTNAGENASSIDDILLDSVNFFDIGLSRFGIFHLDITRTPEGNMTVFLNSTKILSALDNTYSLSSVVHISNFQDDTFFDNIIVEDDYSFIPELPPTTTSTSTPGGNPSTTRTPTTGGNPTTTTTDSSSPGFGYFPIFFSLMVILLLLRRRRT